MEGDEIMPDYSNAARRIQTDAGLNFHQIIYLDFDGELTRYNGEILTVDPISVEDSGLTADRIADIAAALNEQFAGRNVSFVTQRPEGTEFSTIYVGKTSAFDSYGHFTGLAETLDSGNRNHSDNAFVNLDFRSGNEAIVEVIAHEAEHLLGTLDHGGEGLAAYADNYYYVYNGEVSSGIPLYDDGGGSSVMYVNSGGTAMDITVSRCGGILRKR